MAEEEKQRSEERVAELLGAYFFLWLLGIVVPYVVAYLLTWPGSFAERAALFFLTPLLFFFLKFTSGR